MKLSKKFTTLKPIYRKILIVLIIFLGILSIAGYFVTTKSNPSQNEPTSTPTKNKTILDDATEERIEGYFLSYKNPHVVYLRQALNAYLARDSSQACIFQGSVDKREDQGIITGLDAFSQTYYKSKFVVFTINDDKDNGKNIQIIFQDKPDRIFYAWVGNNPDKKLCLLGFNSTAKIDEKTFQSMFNYYEPLILDKTHSL